MDIRNKYQTKAGAWGRGRQGWMEQIRKEIISIPTRKRAERQKKPRTCGTAARLPTRGENGNLTKQQIKQAMMG